jgi:hypothetical protein
VNCCLVGEWKGKPMSQKINADQGSGLRFHLTTRRR